MLYTQKIKRANKIINRLIDEVSHIFLETETEKYAAAKFLLPWLEEDAENAIKSLELKAEDEMIYLQKINNYMGKYSDNPPYKNTSKQNSG